MLTIHGLKTCDECRALRKRLKEAGIAHQFVDVREQVPSALELDAWAAAVGWERLLNRQSTTWRQLAPDRRAAESPDALRNLVQEFPTLLKRPLVVHAGRATIGLPAGLID